MAGQTLTTNIVINAKAGSGFSKVGSTLTELGSMVNGLSQAIISFGEDSLTVYRDYEKSMRDAEVALSTTYGRGTQQLQTVMRQLDESATEWAATTIFHTNDVANAISEAAHAGWDLDEIMNGIPAAMQLAQAGSLDLSEAVDYIVKSTSAAGIGFEDLGEFIDLWSFAANSSASTIGEFGDAMLRMGSTMRFAANPEELMTLIAVTANAGAVGSEAGTMIRNSIMRLVAPTQKAQEAMALLGATTDETAGLMDDEALAAANAALEAHGFAAFDENGDLRNILDIYTDLAAALADIAGGYENISGDEEALGILGSIFPTRTITEALNLINSAAASYDGLYEAMMGGEAAGYGSYAAATMMDTLDGAIEIYESKIERLKQVVGGQLKDQAIDAVGFIGDIVDSIAEMDPDSMSALIKGAETLAAAGPALLAAGTTFRLLGFVANPIGLTTAALLGLGAASAALNEIDAKQFEDNFGEMDLDMAELTEYVGGLGEGFREAYTEADRFREAAEAAIESYTAFSGELGQTLLTDMLTNRELTAADRADIQKTVDEMLAAGQDAVTNRRQASLSYWEALFGGTGRAGGDAYNEILDLTNDAYSEALAEAESIGRSLREALTAAFSDGELSAEEYDGIQSYMQSYNDAIAQAATAAQAEEDYIKTRKWLHEAQTASLEDIQELAQTAAAERDSILADQEDAYLTERYRLEYRGSSQNALDEADARYQTQRMQTEAAYDEFLTELWGSQIRQSGQADSYAWLSGIASQYLNGGMTADTALALVEGTLGKSAYAGDAWGGKNSDRAQLGKMLGFWIDSMGGEEEVGKRIGYYRDAGDTETAQQLAQMYAMEQLANGFQTVVRTGRAPWDLLGVGGDFATMAQGDNFAGLNQYNRSQAEAVFAGYAGDYTADAARRTVETLGGEDGMVGQFFDAVGRQIESGDAASSEVGDAARKLTEGSAEALSEMITRLSEAYDFSAILRDFGGDIPMAQAGTGYQDAFAAWQLLYGGIDAEEYRIRVTPELDEDALETDFDPVKLAVEPVLGAMAELPVMPVQLEPYMEGDDALGSLREQGVEVSIAGDAAELSATIDGEDGQTLLEYVDGDATDLQMKITAQDGQILEEWVTGDASSLAAIINSYNGRTITVNIRGNQLFAEGGRATTASIFGEAGPEWAIPEEHSARTAALLDAARAASGFTWGELLASAGGLGADAGHTETTLVYSPVINAQDARGVESVLRDDWQRFQKWMEEKQMRDAVEVYR